MKINEAIKFYTNQLSLFSESPKLDCELLISHVTKYSKSYLYTWPDHEISSEHIRKINDCISLRKKGISIARIIGQAEFWDLTFIVNEHTLIPRPDTETIIEIVLANYNESDTLSILDLGTGTGAIAITLASIFKKSFIFASDISSETLSVAQRNAKLNNVNNISFIISDWYSNISNKTQFDIIISNPPYIDVNDDCIEKNVKLHEPDIALFSKENGLHDLFKIISNTPNHLKSNGLLILEHGHQQGNIIHSSLEKHGYRNILAHYDLNRIHRVSSARK